MFTGLIQEVGTVVSVAPSGPATRVTIDTGRLRPDLTIGDSLAVDGVCLTVETFVGESNAEFFASPETLDRTTLGRRRPGDRVNLEPCLRAGDRLGGHFVQGHVDGAGEIRAIEQDSAESWRVRIAAPESMRDWLTPKGSIAVDGVSLTIAALDDLEFELAIIPHTWDATTLPFRRVGDPVNLEADIIAKQVHRLYMRQHGAPEAPRPTGLAEALKESGFLG